MTLSTEQQIKMLAAYKGISQSEIARLIDVSPQSLSNRIRRGTLTRDDLNKIAKAVGAEYEAVFKFSDGTII